MNLVERHIINKSSEFYEECDSICFKSKNLYNYANYLVRQEFIQSSKDKEAGLVEHANYLNYYSINRNLIDAKQFDMYELPIKVSNQVLMMLDKNWKSFFASIKKYMANKSAFTGKPSLPKYLDKKGRFITTYELGAISKKELKYGIVKLSGTNIRIGTKKENIKQCRVIPRLNHYVIEVVYEVSEPEIRTNNNRYAAIDLGLDNLACVSSNVMAPLIINGKPMKSVNQYYNKKDAHYKSILEKQTGRKSSNRLRKLNKKRTTKIDDYLHKASRCIINHLVSNSINTLVVGNNKGWKQEINIGSQNNQNFVGIPHSRFISMLSYKCKLEGINFILTEESYTSKCSFLDMEDIGKHETYKGKRIKRGLFRSSNGKVINADLNGSLNILRKVVPNITDFCNNGIEAISVSPRVITL